ncbi:MULTISPECIES: hypothetical protein [unclassified Neptuniibacter]|uniref:hypothetical protein n=1 Tax=unclassified Neptuniibacter TaxID=2630693 RepID=UPI000C45651E|nr:MULTISPECIES: hypothetical protein [unclassified Neptuniibacter]MAY41071.1 hypothetical protein [Oceanospirillaceae bacterium]|tara:strand:+ start:27586 stop:27816 length:231 start_codon:yes stop_codon:yes gene_type:complete
MKECQKCIDTIEENDGYPTQEQLENIGVAKAKKWCEICQQLMIANYRIRKECDQPQDIFSRTPHSKSDSSYTRFDV